MGLPSIFLAGLPPDKNNERQRCLGRTAEGKRSAKFQQVAKKSKKRPSKGNTNEVNKAKQVQLLQKQQRQQLPPSRRAAKAGRNKDANFKSPPAFIARAAASSGGGVASGGHAPTGSGPPAHPWDPKRELPTRGLLNLGNTCFFNSALQNVFKARLLHKALFADGSGRRKGEYIGPLTKAFRKVLLEMSGEGPVGGRRGAYSPKPLLSAVQRAHPSFRGFHQQDAHELFMRLVGTLEDEENLCIKKRRQEVEEAEEEEAEEENDEAEDEKGAEEGKHSGEDTNQEDGTNDSCDGVIETEDGGGGEASGDSAEAAGVGLGAPASLLSEEPRKTCKGGDLAEGNVGYAGGAEDGDVVTPGEGEKGPGPDVVASHNIEDASTTPGGPPSPGDSSSIIPENGGGKEVGGGAEDGPADIDVVKSPLVAGTSPLRWTVEAPSATVGEGCFPKNVVEKGCTANGKDANSGAAPIPSAVVGSSEAACVATEGEEKRVAECSSVDAVERILGSLLHCDSDGCGIRDAHSDTSSDEGETTDAGDHCDVEQMSGDGSISAPRSPVDTPAECSGADLAAAAAGADEEEESGEADNETGQEMAAAASSAVPQQAAVTEVFGGTMCSVVTCGTCGARTFCTEPTVCLSLEIPSRSKPLSKTALAFIAKKRAAAAAKTAAAATEPPPTDSSAAVHQLRPDFSSDQLEEHGIETTLFSDGKLEKAEGFELSAKEKRKIARQELEKRRSIDAEAKANEEATEESGLERDGVITGTAQDSTNGGEVAAQMPEGDDREVWQCLEYESVCAAPATPAPVSSTDSAACGGDGKDETGPDSGAVAAAAAAVEEKDTIDATEIGAGETGCVAPEALLPGFELSAKERNEKNVEGQRSMIGATSEASAGVGGAATPQEVSDKADKRPHGGEGDEGAVIQTRKTSVDGCLAPAEGAAKETAEQAVFMPIAEGQGQSAVDYRSGGGDGVGGSDAWSVPSVATGPASPDAGACEQHDGYGLGGGGCPPALEDSRSRVDLGGKAEETKDEGAAAGAANDGQTHQAAKDLREDVKEENPDGAKASRSSEKLFGCTTGETNASTDPRDELGNTFGNEGGEGYSTEEKHEAAVDGEPGEELPVVDSPPMRLEDQEGARVGEKIIPGEQGSPFSDGGVVATDENDKGVLRDSGGTPSDNTDDSGGEPAAAAALAEEEDGEDGGNDGSSAASESPLNRLQDPPARMKRTGRHDADGMDLYSCLDHFMAEETLVAEDGNGYDCENCSSRRLRPRAAAAAAAAAAASGGGVKAEGSAKTVQQNARKRLLMLGQPPGMLVCHLKRLQAKKKIIRSVEFPIELDMAPYFWRDPDAPLSPKQTCYRLTGLIQHRGSRLSGHYVAYVRDKDGWKHASDSAIRPATLPELKASEAYMLFYERIDADDVEEDESGCFGDAIVDGNSHAAESSGAATEPQGVEHEEVEA